MSSKPHHTATAEKSSDPHPTGLETSSTKFCPHCGFPLEDSSLAQHMARGVCEEHRSRNEDTPKREQTDSYREPPTLENHDRREHVEPDTDARRDLADELEEAGVWPTGGVE